MRLAILALFRAALLTIAAILIAGCSSVWAPGPVGIGSDLDALKRSPCACQPVRQTWG